MNHRTLFALFVASFALVACPDNRTPVANNIQDDIGPRRDTIPSPDVRYDVRDLGPIDGTLVRTPLQAGVDPNGHPNVDVALGGGETRAGVLADNGGFEGVWAHCKPGDFKLYNAQIELCIQGVETNRYEFFRGGLLVDARKVGDTEQDEFDVLTFRKDLSVFNAQEVYVVRDGSDGRTAVIRADGNDLPIAHFVGAIGTAVFPRFDEMRWTVEYRLRPDSDYVEVVTWLTDQAGTGLLNIDTGDVVGFGDRFTIWAPQFGFDVPMIGDTTFVVGQNEHQTFGWISPEPTDQFAIPFGDVPWFLARDPGAGIPAGEEYAKLRWLALGDTVTDVHQIRETLLGSTRPEQQVVVRRTNGDPVVAKLVEILDGNGVPHALGETNASGVLRFPGEPGTYGFIVEPEIGAEPMTVTAETPTEIVLPFPGVLDVLVDVEGTPVAARVEIHGTTSNHEYVVNPNNPEPIEVEPGQYRVTVDKGMEFDFFAADVTITTGQSTKILVTLNRTVDTPDYIAGDFHQHLEPSIDSAIHIEQRVLDNVGQGVEFVTPTDHEVISDLQPYIDALGFASTLSTVPGIEVSPLTTHFNLYPMEYKVDERARGSIPLAVLEEGEPVQRTIPEMMALARDHSSQPVIQINHGRGDSGFFSTVDHDPATNPLLNDNPRYSPEYDAMEVINTFSDTCDLFTDWASHLNVGARITAMGNSDSHGVYGQAGYPRNYLQIPGAIAGNITAEQLKDAVLQNRVTVAANVFIDFTDGTLPGDTVAVTPNVARSFAVRVQTPNFAVADTLIVIVNGVVVQELDISGATVEETIDFDGIVDVTTDVDAWVTFVAVGPRVATEVFGGRHVVGFTNAIILDADGDTLFTGPGPLAMDLLALNKHGLCQ